MTVATGFIRVLAKVPFTDDYGCTRAHGTNDLACGAAIDEKIAAEDFNGISGLLLGRLHQRSFRFLQKVSSFG